MAMNFGQALEQVKLGSKIVREGWNGKGIYVTYKPGYPDGIPANEAHAKAHNIPVGTIIKYLPYLEMNTSSVQSEAINPPRGVVPWLASQTDILAEDWLILL